MRWNKTSRFVTFCFVALAASLATDADHSVLAATDRTGLASIDPLVLDVKPVPTPLMPGMIDAATGAVLGMLRRMPTITMSGMRAFKGVTSYRVDVCGSVTSESTAGLPAPFHVALEKSTTHWRVVRAEGANPGREDRFYQSNKVCYPGNWGDPEDPTDFSGAGLIRP